MFDFDGINAVVESTFGQPALYTTKAGDSYELSGVFDEAFSEVDVTDGGPVTTVSPCFGFRLLSLAVTPRQGDKLLIYAAPGAPLVDTKYVIKQPRVDGHGWCRLILNLGK